MVNSQALLPRSQLLLLCFPALPETTALLLMKLYETRKSLVFCRCFISYVLVESTCCPNFCRSKALPSMVEAHPFQGSARKLGLAWGSAALRPGMELGIFHTSKICGFSRKIDDVRIEDFLEIRVECEDLNSFQTVSWARTKRDLDSLDKKRRNDLKQQGSKSASIDLRRSPWQGEQAEIIRGTSWRFHDHAGGLKIHMSKHVVVDGRMFNV